MIDQYKLTVRTPLGIRIIYFPAAEFMTTNTIDEYANALAYGVIDEDGITYAEKNGLDLAPDYWDHWDDMCDHDYEFVGNLDGTVFNNVPEH